MGVRPGGIQGRRRRPPLGLGEYQRFPGPLSDLAWRARGPDSSFGQVRNHRKRESLNATSPNGTGAVVESYVRWVDPSRGHVELVDDAWRHAGTAQGAFDELYESLDGVTRFGRLAKFDYLTNVGRVGLSPIVPGSTYMGGATGPRRGGQLLFGSSDSAKDLDRKLVDFDAELRVGFDVLEDALCNWAKSPEASDRSEARRTFSQTRYSAS